LVSIAKRKERRIIAKRGEKVCVAGLDQIERGAIPLNQREKGGDHVDTGWEENRLFLHPTGEQRAFPGKGKKKGVDDVYAEGEGRRKRG